MIVLLPRPDYNKMHLFYWQTIELDISHADTHTDRHIIAYKKEQEKRSKITSYNIRQKWVVSTVAAAVVVVVV